jgi:hypothetical protein
MKVTACIMFNHPHPSNIPFLREVYSRMFDDVLFVQPLVSSLDSDVHTSYRGSYAFHGMIVDIAKILLDRGSDYFLFIQDDVLLNPLFTAPQLIGRLGVKDNGAFVHRLLPVIGDAQDWGWTSGFIWKLFYPMNHISGSGVGALSSYFPDAEETRQRLESQYGFSFSPITYDRSRPTIIHHVVGNPSHSETIERNVLDGVFATAQGASYMHLPFPFCSGNCDFLALDRKTLKAAIPMLGITAAANLFVEIALPTAIIVAANHVVMSKDVGLSAELLWTEDERNCINDDNIARRFCEDLLFVHPIKLSKDRERFLGIIEKARRHAGQCW